MVDNVDEQNYGGRNSSLDEHQLKNAGHGLQKSQALPFILQCF